MLYYTVQEHSFLLSLSAPVDQTCPAHAAWVGFSCILHPSLVWRVHTASPLFPPLTNEHWRTVSFHFVSSVLGITTQWIGSQQKTGSLVLNGINQEGEDHIRLQKEQQIHQKVAADLQIQQFITVPFLFNTTLPRPEVSLLSIDSPVVFLNCSHISSYI